MIIKHMRTDPNAKKHVAAGQAATALGICAAVFYMGVFSHSWIGAAFVLLAGGIGGSLLAGIAIELVQRWQRRGKDQNSITESLLDALTTALWPIWYLGGKP